MQKKICIILPLVLILITPKGFSQDPDRRAVLKVSQDYVDAMYQADAGKMEKCLKDPFIKNGYYWKSSEGSYSEMTSLSRAQLVQIAKDWNRDKWVPEDAPRELDLLDMQEKIALVKLTAFWGVEYLQLVKSDQGWLIVQILSQNYAKKIDQGK